MCGCQKTKSRRLSPCFANQTCLTVITRLQSCLFLSGLLVTLWSAVLSAAIPNFTFPVFVQNWEPFWGFPPVYRRNETTEKTLNLTLVSFKKMLFDVEMFSGWASVFLRQGASVSPKYICTQIETIKQTWKKWATVMFVMSLFFVIWSSWCQLHLVTMKISPVQLCLYVIALQIPNYCWYKR